VHHAVIVIVSNAEIWAASLHCLSAVVADCTGIACAAVAAASVATASVLTVVLVAYLKCMKPFDDQPLCFCSAIAVVYARLLAMHSVMYCLLKLY
jgi:hypothetical protein